MASSGPETLLFLGQRMGDGCHLTLSSHPAQENIGTRLAQAVTKGADTKFPERSRADWKHGNRKRLNGKIAGEARGVPTYPTVHLGSLVWGGRSLVRNISASNPPPPPRWYCIDFPVTLTKSYLTPPIPLWFTMTTMLFYHLK